MTTCIRRLLVVVALVATFAALPRVFVAADVKATTHHVQPGPHVQRDLQAILIQAVPGDVVVLAEGKYEFDAGLSVTAANVTIRGQGRDKTILSFKKQQMGANGIEATGDNFVIEHLAIEDAKGDALKVLGAKNVTVRGVRAEWTGGPKTSNGAYGIYPVQCENVLIEDCVARGASDAGIYVGQSRRIVVRKCRAEENVAGIEIENSFDADVYDNLATNNTGGILVFDLPGLDVKNGGRVRVFKNRVVANNHPNFGAPGSAVANVTPGTGLMLLAMDNVEFFENEIVDNDSSSITIISYLITGNPITDPHYDPFPETAYVHDNKITGGGTKPQGRVKQLLVPLVGLPFPDVFWDGGVNPRKLKDGKLPPELGIRIERNGAATFVKIPVDQLTPANVLAGKVPFDRDLAAHAGSFPRLPEVALKPHGPADPTSDPSALVYRTAPKKLSEYRLFAGNGRTQQPVDGVIPYDLNTELFADYTTKYRFIRLPRGGVITYQGDDVLEFPVGTIIAKTFAMPYDLNDPAKGERLLETRIIERKPTGWYGYAYEWNAEQTEATLALGGSSVDVSWKHHDGGQRANNYVVPHANQCKSCHVSDGKTFLPLGPKPRNLNKDFKYGHGTENQLAHLAVRKLLQGAPPIADLPRVPRLDDPATGTVAERARVWLDVNCAHCHNPGGPARTSGLDLRLEQANPAKLGVWKTPVAAGRGSGDRKYDIVPGKPDESIFVYRLESTEPGIMMPELPRRLVHAEAVALIKQWIRQMEDPLTAKPQR